MSRIVWKMDLPADAVAEVLKLLARSPVPLPPMVTEVVDLIPAGVPLRFLVVAVGAKLK